MIRIFYDDTDFLTRECPICTTELNYILCTLSRAHSICDGELDKCGIVVRNEGSSRRRYFIEAGCGGRVYFSYKDKELTNIAFICP